MMNSQKNNFRFSDLNSTNNIIIVQNKRTHYTYKSQQVEKDTTGGWNNTKIKYCQM